MSAGRGKDSVMPAWMSGNTAAAPTSAAPASHTNKRPYQSDSTAPTTSKAARIDNDLPPGWSEAFDATYEAVYYFNLSTGERSWEKPAPVAVAAVEEEEEQGVWESAVDPETGKRYYFNTALSITQWDPPSGWQEPPPKQHQELLYQPAATFSGARAGYVYQIGPLGVGYYFDSPDTCTILGEPPLVLENKPEPTLTAAQEQKLRHQQQQQRKEQQEKQKQKQANQGRGRGRGGSRPPEIDPMDPSSYSDAPVGGWARGLGQD